MEAILPTRLSFLRPRHYILNILRIIFCHFMLILYFWFGKQLPIWCYIPITFMTCLIHQRAMSEWLHEGAHYNLIGNMRWNDVLVNILSGVFLGMAVSRYRESHFVHHATDSFFENDRDTDFLTIKTKRDWWKAILCDVTGVTAIKQYWRFKKSTKVLESSKISLYLIILTHLVVLAAVIQLNQLSSYIFYYSSLIFLYPLLNRLRVYGQHVSIGANRQSVFRGSACSRTIEAGFLDRIFFTSPLLLYHYEHHKWPHLPYRALGDLCTRSSDINCYTKSRWHILKAIYLGLPKS